MANPKTITLVVDNLAELELANASLATRVGELEAELATAGEREAQAARDLGTARSNLITSEAERARAAARAEALTEQLTAVEAQRDQAAVLLRERDADLAGAAREIEGLHDELRRRSSSAPLAFNITALLELHRIVGSDSDRYLATARRLGDALVAQLDVTDRPPT